MKLSSRIYVLSMITLLLHGGELTRFGLSIMDLNEVKN